MAPQLPDQVEEAFAARIAALDATAYVQQSATAYTAAEPAAWREAQDPFDVPQEGLGRAHLAYSVLVTGNPVTKRTRGESGGFAKIRAQMVVAFTYRIPAADQVAATRLAWRAGWDVVRAVMAPWEHGQVVVQDTGRPAKTKDGGWLMMVIPFDVIYDYPL